MSGRTFVVVMRVLSLVLLLLIFLFRSRDDSFESVPSASSSTEPVDTGPPATLRSVNKPASNLDASTSIKIKI